MKRFSIFFLSLLVLSACGGEKLPVEEVDLEQKVVEVEEVEVANEVEEVKTVNLDEASDGGLTMGLVAMNDSEESCYSVIEGKVYDLTGWIKRHPGGAANVLKICGKDGSGLFGGKHGENAAALAELKNYYLGDLM